LIQTFCYVVEGILMLGVGTMGILLNIFSICFFIRQRTHRTFHRPDTCLLVPTV
jgi:hypothetical protein